MRNRGQEMLLAALQLATRATIAPAIGVTPQALGQWAAGLRVPTNYFHRLALRRVLGIPFDAWEQNETALSPREL